MQEELVRLKTAAEIVLGFLREAEAVLGRELEFLEKAEKEAVRANAWAVLVQIRPTISRLKHIHRNLELMKVTLERALR